MAWERHCEKSLRYRYSLGFIPDRIEEISLTLNYLMADLISWAHVIKSFKLWFSCFFFFLLWYENHSYINTSVLALHKQLIRELKQSKERSKKYMSHLQHDKFFSLSPSYCFWRSRSHSRCQTPVLCIPLPHRYLFVFFGYRFVLAKYLRFRVSVKYKFQRC